MKKYLEKNYIFNISMENVPKNYRFKLPNRAKINLKKEISQLNSVIKEQKKYNENILKTKLNITENKLNIYFYNGDFYNYYRTFLKYKKLSIDLILKYENSIENRDNFDIIIENIETDEIFSNEYAYLKVCDYIKSNLEYYEERLNVLYAFFKLQDENILTDEDYNNLILNL